MGQGSRRRSRAPGDAFVSAKRGLGRGLGAFFPDGQGDRPSSPLQQVPVSAIHPNPQQPRRAFGAGPLEELAASLALHGVLVPLLVRPLAGGRYELIAGERRWRAAQIAGLSTVPAVVRSADDRQSLEVAILENLQREDLDPLEEAMGFRHLIDEYGFTQEQVAERLGRSRPAIANSLRLLSLPDEIQAELRSGALTAGHARALLGAKPGAIRELAKRIVAQGLTVRQTERLVTLDGAVRRRERRRRHLEHDAEVAAFEQQLRERLGAPIAIVPQGMGGRLEIRYADADDLMRIGDLLLGLPS
ncbi:ParB/RepB/Spo0J family partition protein [bacterium]|nr:MAG: ParB/RepB/Spo0J family partition protein [bacterium]